MTAALFDATPYVVELPTLPKVSAQRRRTVRQHQAAANGVHPLGLALGYPIAMHPDAPRDRTGDGPRCGTCWYRKLLRYHHRKYPKCLFDVENETDQRPGLAHRVSHGPGTDVRAWWPACVDYSLGDPRVSPDAARYIPGAAP